MNNQKQDYPVSNLATIFPDMTPDEYEALKSSIRDQGLHEPIAVWKDQIIDGRHRLRACLELGVTPRFEHLPDNVDPIRYGIARNLSWRHLTTNARAVAAARLSLWSRPGGDRKSPAYHLSQDQYAHLHSGLDQRQASTLLGVSLRLTNMACKVLAEDGPAIPQVREAVERDQIKISDAARVLGEPPEVQEQALIVVQRGEARTITHAVQAVLGGHSECPPIPRQPAGPYRTIVVDPPWPRGDLMRQNGTDDPGVTDTALTIDHIAGMKLPLAANGFVFLWTTEEHLLQAIKILERWTLSYRFTMVWLKGGGIRPPNSSHHDVEFVVVGAKGMPKFTSHWSISAVIDEPCDDPLASPSVKPKAFYDRVKRVVPGPMLELPEDGVKHWPVWKERSRCKRRR